MLVHELISKLQACEQSAKVLCGTMSKYGEGDLASVLDVHDDGNSVTIEHENYTGSAKANY
jgi:hypothetical protein